MDLDHVRSTIEHPAASAPARFSALGEIAELAAYERGEDVARDLLIRALEHRAEFAEDALILDALVRQSGLFPYLDARSSSAADAIAYEAHRPLNFPGVVFHTEQSGAYQALLAGESVVLMAPTSFGKSLIIDALVASGRYGNVVVIVPTIALIDEARTRLSRRFGQTHSIVTHASQALGERNLVILTQERALELDAAALDPLDLLVIDEFYKLDPRMDPERSALLNQAFHRLSRRAGQMYLLGPNVEGLSPTLPSRFAPTQINTSYRTVAVEVEHVDVPSEQREAKLIEICRTNDGPTLVYCRAPGGCRRVASALAAAGLGQHRPELDDAATWIAAHHHPEWIVPKVINHGIGIHHAQLPRWLGQYMVRAFNNGHLDYLVCTSTLIEGVNTAAKNVVIYDNKVGSVDLDRFTFENISGRAGRMWRHFIGRVFHFHPRPAGPLQTIDIPILSQPEDTPAEILLELPEAELTAASKDRLQPIVDQQTLPLELLRRHPGVPPQRQLALADAILEDPEFYEDDLAWTAWPEKEQLRRACELIWEHLVVSPGMRHGIASAKQLAGRIDRFRADPDIRRFIADELAGNYVKGPDEAVERVMQFIRNWASFDLPKFLLCLDDIQREVLGRRELEAGDYRPFAAAVEGLFLPAFYSLLDEYGIPLQLADRLAPRLGNVESLDELLARLRELDLDSVSLSTFERDLIADARERL
jgi:hypothetical protein